MIISDDIIINFIIHKNRFNQINSLMTDSLLRVKQMRSCPYLTFRFLNLLVLLNQLANTIIAIVLVLELWETQGVYVWSYLGVEIAGLVVSLFAFRIAPNLLTMGRTRRKWVLQLVYLI